MVEEGGVAFFGAADSHHGHELNREGLTNRKYPQLAYVAGSHLGRRILAAGSSRR
jgi:hypothetical protein